MKSIHFLAVMAMAAMCTACSSKNATKTYDNLVVSTLQKEKPTSAHEYLLKGQVKSLSIRSYKPSVQKGKVVKGAADFSIQPYSGATRSCDVTFKKDGSIVECIYVYRSGEKPLTRKETFQYKNGLCVHSTGYDDYANWNYDYTYQDGRLLTFSGVEEVTLGEGTYSYPSVDSICISYGDLLFSYEAVDIIRDNKVVEHHVVRAPNEPTEPYISHYTYTYNKQGDVAKELLVKTGETKGRFKKTLEYIYDNQENWLTCVVRMNGKPEAVVEREIRYFGLTE